MKTCVTCKRSLGSDSFPPNRARKDGLNPKCRDCYNEYMKKWYADNSVKHKERVGLYKTSRRTAIKAQKYGITEKQLLTGLAGSCNICGSRAEVVDHDHASGTFRGFLCNRCNLGLGHFADSVEKLKKAIKYLGT